MRAWERLWVKEVVRPPLDARDLVSHLYLWYEKLDFLNSLQHWERVKQEEENYRRIDGKEEEGCAPGWMGRAKEMERREKENQTRRTVTMATAAESHVMWRREGEMKQKGGASRSAGRQQRRWGKNEMGRRMYGKSVRDEWNISDFSAGRLSSVIFQ